MVDTKKTSEVKNRIGNGEAKELICTTHGHELREGNAGGRGYRAEGNKGGKWDNCNSVINKIYLPLSFFLSFFIYF